MALLTVHPYPIDIALNSQFYLTAGSSNIGQGFSTFEPNVSDKLIILFQPKDIAKKHFTLCLYGMQLENNLK